MIDLPFESTIGLLAMLNRPTLFALIVLAVVSRLLPHPPNFVFVGALGLLAGCHLRGVQVVLVPLVAMLLSDIIGHVAAVPGMGFYHPLVMVSVYVGIALSGVIGMSLRRNRSALRIGAAGLACSTSFFLLSNFGNWAAGMYPATLAGLASCYTAALPFFQYTLAGDLFYASITFGSLALWQHAAQRGVGRSLVRGLSAGQ